MVSSSIKASARELRRVYGAYKVWKQLKREHFMIARCTVERLKSGIGLEGVRRDKVVQTTVPDRHAICPLDRVHRQFRADQPNQLWVSDFTYISNWQRPSTGFTRQN